MTHSNTKPRFKGRSDKYLTHAHFHIDKAEECFWWVFAYVGKFRDREGKCTFLPILLLLPFIPARSPLSDLWQSAETGRTRTPNPFNFSVISWCYKRANQQWFPQHQETSLFSYLICDQSADIEGENVLKNSSPLPPYSNLPTRPTPSSIYTAMTLYCLPNVIVMLGRQLPNILPC